MCHTHITHIIIDEAPNYDVKLVMGDFNAKLDSDRTGLSSTVGPHGSAMES